MRQPLADMTNEELWQLFPIFLTPHRDCWVDWYVQEAHRIKTFLPLTEYRLSHIGSTAIRGIWAKPIVDILLEVPQDASMAAIKDALTHNGYRCMCTEDARMDFNRGYTESGFAERVFHLHLRFFGDCDELYFRDYMNENPALANQYEALKLSLWKRFEFDRDGYTAAKGDFIRLHTEAAKKKYGERYH